MPARSEFSVQAAVTPVVNKVTTRTSAPTLSRLSAVLALLSIPPLLLILRFLAFALKTLVNRNVTVIVAPSVNVNGIALATEIATARKHVNANVTVIVRNRSFDPLALLLIVLTTHLPLLTLALLRVSLSHRTRSRVKMTGTRM